MLQDSPTHPIAVVSGGLSAATAADSPPCVTRGVNKKGRPCVSLDWITVVVSDASLMEAVAVLEEHFGPTARGRGRGFMRGGGFRVGGGGVFFDGDKDYCLCDISGDLLALLAGSARVHLLTSLLSLGGRATRVDVAVDWEDGNASALLDQMLASCEAGELCGARTFRLIDEKSGRSAKGRTLYLGKRGKSGSGRMVRAYDKGLETGESSVGQWVRWETVFSGPVAAQVAEGIALCDDPEALMLEVALGAVDFRSSNGSTSLKRRTRCGWFAALLAGVKPNRVKAAQPASTLRGYAEWMRRCVVPQMRRYADHVGVSVSDFLAEVVGDDVAPDDVLFEPVGIAIAEHFGVSRDKRPKEWRPRRD